MKTVFYNCLLCILLFDKYSKNPYATFFFPQLCVMEIMEVGHGTWTHYGIILDIISVFQITIILKCCFDRLNRKLTRIFIFLIAHHSDIKDKRLLTTSKTHAIIYVDIGKVYHRNVGGSNESSARSIFGINGFIQKSGLCYRMLKSILRIIHNFLKAVFSLYLNFFLEIYV